MFAKASLLVALTAALSVMASPTPLNAVERAADASPTITLCTAVQFGGICVKPAVVSDTCINLTGGLTTLNEEVSSAVVPAGFICTFFDAFGCTTSDPANSDKDEVGLVGGSYPSFGSLSGINGALNFNDKSSSFSCSPL
ncbi:hypothetical protein K435DRAFT_784047 [Dendrothele bispora CBS 962.96]|uniref:Hydrophobin n=1 Tax=Dendrothele bispora (strain CBS 962.96) TaxID=1314807 RepID=A0A4S8L5I9_DENBC|nr:hypothetical protein K435DRAFT_784047 [Dendrothele bispora CBS 962.96]